MTMIETDHFYFHVSGSWIKCFRAMIMFSFLSWVLITRELMENFHNNVCEMKTYSDLREENNRNLIAW